MKSCIESVWRSLETNRIMLSNRRQGLRSGGMKTKSGARAPNQGFYNIFQSEVFRVPVSSEKFLLLNVSVLPSLFICHEKPLVSHRNVCVLFKLFVIELK